MKHDRSAPLLSRYYSGRVGPAFFAHLFKAVAKQHHRELMPLFRALLSDDALVVDVGAHSGQFTKLFARLAPKGFVFAVEPQAYARRILATATRLQRLTNVAILPMALGEASEVALLSVPIKASGSYGFGLANLSAAVGERRSEIEAVAVVTLDQCVSALGLDRLDLIKADIEGAELAMLRGARRALQMLRPALYIELDESISNWTKVILRALAPPLPTPGNSWASRTTALTIRIPAASLHRWRNRVAETSYGCRQKRSPIRRPPSARQRREELAPRIRPL